MGWHLVACSVALRLQKADGGLHIVKKIGRKAIKNDISSAITV
jgi:hypothetical protein